MEKVSINTRTQLKSHNTDVFLYPCHCRNLVYNAGYLWNSLHADCGPMSCGGVFLTCDRFRFVVSLNDLFRKCFYCRRHELEMSVNAFRFEENVLSLKQKVSFNSSLSPLSRQMGRSWVGPGVVRVSPKARLALVTGLGGMRAIEIPVAGTRTHGYARSSRSAWKRVNKSEP